MKALRIHEFGGALAIEEVEKPVAGPGQVIIRNEFTTLNPIDPLRASGAERQVFPLEFPWIPGGDTSGTIESVGEGVTGFKIGDAVFGYNPAGGAYAEFAAADTASIAIRPPELSVEQAAAIAMVSQTATQALNLAKVGSGTIVLIHGGSGGVGSLAIQIAHQSGAHVITTARPEHADTLLHLGADRVIDYATEKFESIEPVDAVLDLIGGETLARSYGVVKRGGIIVTANQPPYPKEMEKHGIQGFFVQTKITTAGLNEFIARVQSGHVKPLIAHTESLWKPETLWAKHPSGAAIGKVVYKILS
jgi:NADPH:quinone reductase-like Zn-dependent oxidoreductase